MFAVGRYSKVVKGYSEWDESFRYANEEEGKYFFYIRRCARNEILRSKDFSDKEECKKSFINFTDEMHKVMLAFAKANGNGKRIKENNMLNKLVKDNHEFNAKQGILERD